jgi:predicted nucleic acid-binding protein
MRIAISDASILIDLANVGLLETLAKLPFDFIVTDFILNEITRMDQKMAIDGLRERGTLRILAASQGEIEQIGALSQAARNLSIPDCSVLVLARINKALILSNDSRIRHHAKESKLECHGTIWILRQFVHRRKVRAKDALDYLSRLMSANPRLPKAECAALMQELAGLDSE